MARGHVERHGTERVGWLRAAILGANDGLISTAALITGVAAASQGRGDVLIAGVAGLVAGAFSMAAGEYVSVSSQADAERADLARERAELASDPAYELEELAAIYERRGLDPALAKQVAAQLTARDALAAHARDELGIMASTVARPIQAAMASALSFTAGAALPLAVAATAPHEAMVSFVSAAAVVFLAGLGALGAHLGGAKPGRAAARVTFWGALALGASAGIGALFGVAG
ncbi:VIT family protein [Phenylobacterium sp.]|uniref:VIT1/CCC1 transporter family protein n=1 Tax=Phenylobacterium sp. TaxID=1871053 RepID=UPI00301CC9C0